MLREVPQSGIVVDDDIDRVHEDCVLLARVEPSSRPISLRCFPRAILSSDDIGRLEENRNPVLHELEGLNEGPLLLDSGPVTFAGSSMPQWAVIG